MPRVEKINKKVTFNSMPSNQMTPLLSIAIATRNRTQYAVHAARSILRDGNPKIEVVIQDNSDESTFPALCGDLLADARLKYRYTPPPFSSIDNFNAAIELSTGKYVCLIGDDDGVSDDILSAVEWADKNDIDCLAGSVSLEYRWPGVDRAVTGGTGSLVIDHFSGKSYRTDLAGTLDRLLRNGGTNYLDFPMPKLYHGIVRRKCLEVVKAKTGNFVGGLSPDIYSAVSLSLVAKSVVRIDYPLTIPGVCPQSTSMSEGRLAAFSRNVYDAPHFRHREHYKWNSEVPAIYCALTIWADSCVSALKDMGHQDLVARLDEKMLIAHLIWKHRELTSDLLKRYWEKYQRGPIGKVFDLMQIYWRILRSPATSWVRYAAKRAIGIVLSRRTRIQNVESITAAMSLLAESLQRNKLKLRLK